MLKSFKKRVILSLLLTISFGVFPMESYAENNRIKHISAKEAFELIKKSKKSKNFIILDIRTAPEYHQARLKDSIIIDYYSPDFKSQLSKLDRNKTYLVYCRSGNRSGHSMIHFKALGFKKVYHMKNGILEWQFLKLPLVSSK